ncbi:hypothetical protein IGI37_000062 [Enterococcus sp. AZ194]|uniref:hypothetical protein n=1 Tax=Enterococcus sp. AZ194 TaxID=2774629 RepID=UPI003F27CB67
MKKKLPAVSEEEMKDAFDWIVKTFIENGNITPSSIKIVAEGKTRDGFSDLLVSKLVFSAPNHHEMFLQGEKKDGREETNNVPTKLRS